MLLNLVRNASTPASTFGTLAVDGVFLCYTLERPEVQIQTGTYSIEMTWSPHFNRYLPLLDNVPGRSAIRIHAGNWPRDTDGCLLVGMAHSETMLLRSLEALNILVGRLQTSPDAISIEIS